MKVRRENIITPASTEIEKKRRKSKRRHGKKRRKVKGKVNRKIKIRINEIKKEVTREYI